ncbi:AraC family transcriptional regulator [Paenibacillus tarimensis]
MPVTWRSDDYIPEFNRLYYIIEGEGFIKVDGKQYDPKPGDLCLLPAGVSQSYGTAGLNTFGKFWCHFTAKTGGFPLFDLLDTPVVISVDDGAVLREKFEKLIVFTRSDTWTSVLYAHAALLEIIGLFLDRAGAVEWDVRSTASLEKLHDVLVYIDEHLGESLSVQKLARIAHFHPNYFIRLFKNITGLSPIQYVNRKRIDKARHLLDVTPLSVTAVAEQLGMELPYFSRLFKEYTGLSPTEYKVLHENRTN